MHKPIRIVGPITTALMFASTVANTVAVAQTDTVADFAVPQSSVQVGTAGVTDDTPRFGQYSGLKDNGLYGLLDIDLVRRDKDSGTWLKVSGKNLGLHDREVSYEQQRQGQWGYSILYSQTPRFDPFIVTTTLAGTGTATQTPTGAATQDHQFKTEREAWVLSFNKNIYDNLGIRLRYREEEKEGARLWGQGTFGTWRFLTDPINQTTRQLDVTLDYKVGALSLHGGYAGSWFENRNAVLEVVGATLFTGSDKMSLPPDNHAHQLHLAGHYAFNATTTTNFKIALGRILQDERFATTPVTNAPTDLDGRIDTTLLQLGLAARPINKLSLHATLRYENRNDKTPVFIYFPSNFATPTTATSDGSNEPRDIKTRTAKFTASYRLPQDLTLNGALEYVEKQRNSPPVRSVSFRTKTDETTVRAALRRAISTTVTGTLTVLHSERGGSDWLTNTFVSSSTFATSSNQVAPLHLADRDRDLVRANISWLPLESLTINTRLDHANDTYRGRRFSVIDQAVRKGTAQNYSLDATYQFSDALQTTAWYSKNNTSLNSQLCRSSNGDVCTPGTQQIWASALRNRSDSYGVNVQMQPTTRLELNAEFGVFKARDAIRLDAISGAAIDPLDDIHTQNTHAQLTARFTLSSDSSIRAQYRYERYELDDWTWADWNYSPTEGGTTILQDPNQSTHFLGLTYSYQF